MIELIALPLAHVRGVASYHESSAMQPHVYVHAVAVHADYL